MRYFHLARRAAALVAFACALLTPRLARAQANSGALDLLFPIGARSVGMGTAVVTEQGSEAVWWNPAGLARMPKPEFALDHFDTFALKGDAVSFVLPSAPVGVFAITARLFDYGLIAGRDTNENPTGDRPNRTVVLGGTFSTAFGSALNAGVTYRYFRGEHDDETYATSTVDLGLQLTPFAKTPLSFGVEVRNLGLSVQVHDKPQADPPPTRLHLGASWAPQFAQLPAELTTRFTVEGVTDASLGEREIRVGGQATYATGPSRLMVRAGFVHAETESLLSGPSLGVGLVNGRVQLDLSRIFDPVSSGLGSPPTYISIRVGL
jgi:hypothetical protein